MCNQTKDKNCGSYSNTYKNGINLVLFIGNPYYCSAIYWKWLMYKKRVCQNKLFKMTSFFEGTQIINFLHRKFLSRTNIFSPFIWMFIRFRATVRIINKDFLSLHVNSYHFRSNFWIKSVHKSKCVLKLMGGVKLSVIQVMPCLSRRGD